jgi:hypothetical protein
LEGGVWFMNDSISKLTELKNKIEAYSEDNYLNDLVGEFTFIALEFLDYFNRKERAKSLLSFVNDRLKAIENNQHLNIKSVDTKAVIHIIPVSLLEDTSKRIELSRVSENTHSLRPLSSDGNYSRRYNYEGYQTFNEYTNYYSYTQLSRNGWIEIIDTSIFAKKEKKIRSSVLEHLLNKRLKDYINFLRNNDISSPFVICINLLGVKDYTHYLPYHSFYDDQYPIDRDKIVLPKVMIDDLKENIIETLKPSLDVLWNATGLAGSPNFNNGEWHPRS